MTPEIGYAAGLFEGEGSVTRGKSKYPAAVIGMTDKEPIEKFLNYIKIGYLGGPYKTKNQKKSVYIWRVSGHDKVANLFNTLKPFLSPRRIAQFEKALTGWKSMLFSDDCGKSNPKIPSQYGWMVHYKKNEPPCISCREAKNLYLREYKKMVENVRIRV